MVRMTSRIGVRPVMHRSFSSTDAAATEQPRHNRDVYITPLVTRA